MTLGLRRIVERIAEGLPILDARDQGGRSNQRTHEMYLPGLKTMTEPEVTLALKDWWPWAHPEDFEGGLTLLEEEPYPASDGAQSCDLVVRRRETGEALWAIELKHIALVGDNGKNNDYGLAKMLSPYLKDRSLLHDVIRLRESGFGGSGAAIVYAFSYTGDSVAESRLRHPDQEGRIRELDKVRQHAEGTGVYTIAPMIELADFMLQSRGLVTGKEETAFRGAWKHPAGGDGIVAGWQVTLVEP